MVLGALRGDGHRTLVRCSKNVDSIEYQRILSISLPQMCNGRTIFTVSYTHLTLPTIYSV